VPNFTRYMAPLESLKSTPQELKDLMHRVSDADEVSRGSPIPARLRQRQHAPQPKPIIAVPKPATQPSQQQKKPRPRMAVGPRFKPAPPLKPSRRGLLWWWYLAAAPLLLITFYLGCCVDDYTSLGYCDSNRDSNVLQDTRAPCVARLVAGGLRRAGQTTDAELHVKLQPVWEKLRQIDLLPTCSSCPSHAVCDSGSLLRCEPNYVAKRSLFGMGPLRCVPDTERMVRIAQEAARVSRLLRRRKGEVICDGRGGLARRADGWEEWRKFGLRESQVRKTLESGRDVGLLLSALATLAFEAHSFVFFARRRCRSRIGARFSTLPLETLSVMKRS
jgi:hypothetical protein